MTSPPVSRRSHLILASSLALVIGATIMILLHETAHAIAGAVMGHHPLQLPFAVDYGPLPPAEDHVISLLVAPAFSLISGLVGVAIDARYELFTRRPFWRLVWLWTLFTSIQEGFGYLQISGLFQAGDTAQAFELLDAPPSWYIVATTVGWICLPLTAWMFAGRIRSMASSDRDKRAIAVWPWMIGTGVFVALMGVYVVLSPISDATVIVAVMAGAIAVGVYAPMSMMFGAKRFGATSSPVIAWPPIGGIALAVILIAFNLTLNLGWFWP